MPKIDALYDMLILPEWRKNYEINMKKARRRAHTLLPSASLSGDTKSNSKEEMLKYI